MARLRISLVLLLGALVLVLVACGAPGETGAPCETADDCAGDTCLLEQSGENVTPPTVEYPGGYCSTTCKKDSDCPCNEACLGYALFDPVRYCYKRCDSNDECREPEYTCVLIDPITQTYELCLPEALRRPWDD